LAPLLIIIFRVLCFSVSAEEILHYPMFWSNYLKLQFIVAVSKHVSDESKSNDSSKPKPSSGSSSGTESSLTLDFLDETDRDKVNEDQVLEEFVKPEVLKQELEQLSEVALPLMSSQSSDEKVLSWIPMINNLILQAW
jgi:hypothetical protein